MSDVLQVLKRRYGASNTGCILIDAPDMEAAIAAIEERDAEIERLRKANGKLYDETQWVRFANAVLDDTAKDAGFWQREAQALARQLAEAKSHRDEFDRQASVERERANGLEYACECAEQQRDAMRGAMTGLIETAADVCRYDLHTPRMMALRAALKEARDVLAGRLGQHGRYSTDGDRREVGSGTTDEIPRIDPPVVAGEGCVGGPDGESGCVSLANGAVTPLDAMRGALEEIRAAARECSVEAGVLLAPDWIVEQCDRALGALGVSR